MSILFLMVPAALSLAAIAVAAFVWAARSGQFDEVDTPPVRMLLDDEPTRKTAGPPTPSGDDP
ncbi:MAG: cbb3-type cytochrome oxidase assembly protein CcoS [Planctomycetota bacterium]